MADKSSPYLPGKPSVSSPVQRGPKTRQEKDDAETLYRFGGSINDDDYPEGHGDDFGTPNYPGYITIDVPDKNLAGRWLVSPQFPGKVFRSRVKVTDNGQANIRVSEGPDNATFEAVDVAMAENVRRGGLSPAGAKGELQKTEQQLKDAGIPIEGREFIRQAEEKRLQRQLKEQYGVEVDNQEIHAARQKAAQDARKELEADPYKYFLQNPAVNDLVEATSDPSDFGALQNLDRAVLALQQRSGLPKSKWNVMPEDDAKTLIAAFDNPETPTIDLVQRVVAVEERFGENTELAISQLSRTERGRAVVDRIRPLLWHTDNPEMMENIAAGMLNKEGLEMVETKLFKEEGSKRQFEHKALNASGMKAYAEAHTAFGTGAAQSNDRVASVANSFKSYAKAMAMKGFSVEESSARFFSAFQKVDLDQGTLLIPGVVGGKRITEADAKRAELHLDRLHEDTVTAVETQRPIRVAGRVVTILPPVGEMSKQLGLDNPRALADLVDDAVWVPTGDQKGVLLAIPGPNGESLPLRIRGPERQGGQEGAVSDFFVPYDQAIMGMDYQFAPPSLSFTPTFGG